MNSIFKALIFVSILSSYNSIAQAGFEIPAFVDLLGDEFNLQKNNVVSNLKVYSEPKESSKLLGEIKFEYVNNILISKFFETEKPEKEVDFKATYFQGQCGDFYKIVSFERVLSQSGAFSQIGPGPWGSNAWVKGKYWKVDDKEIPLKFSIDRNKIRSLRISANSVGFNFEDNSGTTLPVNRLYNEDGSLAIEPSCKGTKFGGSLKTEPRFVNLKEKKHDIDFDNFGCSSPYTAEGTCEYSDGPCSFEVLTSRFMNSKISFILADENDLDLIISYKNLRRSSVGRHSDSGGFTFGGIYYPSKPRLYILKRPKSSDFWKMSNPRLPESISSFEFSDSFLDKRTTLTLPKEFHKVKFQISKNVLDFSLYIGQVLVARGNGDKPIELSLAPGQYEFRFVIAPDFSDGKDYFKEINVPKIAKDSELNIVAELNKFEDFEFDSSSWYDDKTGKFSFSHPIPSYNKKITKIDNVIIDGNKKVNAIHFIESVNNSYQIKKEKLQDFNKLVSDWTPTKIHLHGQCKIHEIKPHKSSFLIHSLPDPSANKLGAIEIFFEKGRIRSKFKSTNNQILDFTPNMGLQYCRAIDGLAVLHQVKEFKDQWSNLGEGPWGENGWINYQSQTIAGSKIQLKYGFADAGYVTKKNDEYFIHWTEGEESKTEKMKLEDFITPSGKLKLEIECDLGC